MWWRWLQPCDTIHSSVSSTSMTTPSPRGERWPWHRLGHVHSLCTKLNICGLLFSVSCSPRSTLQALRHLRNVQVVNFGDCLVRSEGAIALAGVLREGLPIIQVRSPSNFGLFRNTCVLCQRSDRSAVMLLPFRTLISHLARLQRQQHLWSLRLSGTNLTWREWTWMVRTQLSLYYFSPQKRFTRGFQHAGKSRVVG